MTTKTCEKCGWVCDIRDPSRFCPICHTKFKEGICNICGRPVVFYRPTQNACIDCYKEHTRTPHSVKLMNDRRRAVYEEWVAKVKKVPKSYPTLTEAQWLEAVRHFNGCALCKSELVDTRWYFIPFKNGGRYCDWNIIPVCADCATKIRINPNYFLYERPAGLIDIINYLEDKLHGAIATCPSAGQQSNAGDSGN